ncbi:MAG: glutamate synthase large subunit [Candidatus Methanoplasma sp.]|jgi:glutamate synthase (NADPH/NADH) large chain|nr:glutamate synthase large subunit [Candidatus Methanoplasma sp.]
MKTHPGLYDPTDERDSCGVGLAVSLGGAPSHEMIERGLRILENMEHRGAENADGRTGDGTGMTVQVPHEFILSLGIPVPESGRYGTGLVFLPRGPASEECMAALRDECRACGLAWIAEREVPVDRSAPGPLASETEPRIVQVFLSSYDGQDALERRLYRARRRASGRIASSGIEGAESFYICSLSSRTIVYKGMLTPAQLRSYYLDLSDPLFKSAIAMVHSRFSTNTLPMWKLAQPFRMLCHNGEINAIRGNRAWMGARESILAERIPADMRAPHPVVEEGMSDSASLDNVFEFLAMAGVQMQRAISMMIPESWNSKNPIPDSLRAYYEYHSILMEPWDGPAAVLFTDGRLAGGMLDRNGLRPARYSVTRDGTFILASEAGVLEAPEGDIVESGRLRPGKMILVDAAAGRVIRDAEIKGALASAYPYRDWLDRNRLELDEVSSGREVSRRVPDARVRLAAFGYTREDVSKVIAPMALQGREPVGSTGFDAPLAILSDRPQRLFSYFRQSFAQITNPPIDPIREELVMSVTGYMGTIGHDVLSPAPDRCNIVKVRHPVITNRELDLLENLRYRGFVTSKISITFPARTPGGLEESLRRVCAEAEAAADAGGSYIVLSDRGISEGRVAIPSLLAVSAVHRHLLATGKRLRTGIILESGEPREVMHFALLMGFGANAVNPYMAYAAIEEHALSGDVRMDADAAERNYVRAAEKGIMKVMSKMGISTIRSYIGAGLFEAVGLDEGMAQRFFGVRSGIGGATLEDIAADAEAAHEAAYAGADPMESDPGTYEHRKGGERHAWTPEAARALTAAARGDPGAYRAFAEASDGGMFFVRDALSIAEGDPVPLSEVEPAESIMKRFVAEGISFGAISREAHEAIAAAMNSVGARSNCGEGGEDPSRSEPRPGGWDARSRVRQIASGRFGVTARYLADADEIQIKISQGAKPGEGGQLLGSKVDEAIASARHTAPGVTLISPPPHHDIYSIEDLKQLIHDARSVNPRAKISVKLASGHGVGTVAAGAAKAGADIVLISGADGGTGASPLSSIRYAGLPWEMGLAETQQALAANGLRGRVMLQADGQLKTGRDVIVAALLGADEYGFATSAMVALGCVMCRRCHLNTCPAGIATQDPERRKRFSGEPEHLARYMGLLAEDVRGWLSRMGFRSMDEIIGRADLLSRKSLGGRAGRLDASRLTAAPQGERRFSEGQPPSPAPRLDARIMGDLASGGVAAEYAIRNTDRSVGAAISGEIARGSGAAAGGLSVSFRGTAGQSFGAFLAEGVSFTLVGRANDYVGKGLSGGSIAVLPEAGGSGDAIAGNTLLYGATSGEAYIRGTVGERFCVRNSGATAVAEGAGDHCCEYMTGGVTVVLGPVGRNFAAGMSAGAAYVLNDGGDFDRHCNMDSVELSPVEEQGDLDLLRGILERHAARTGSAVAAGLLADWGAGAKRFLKVSPTERGKPAPRP